MTEQSKATIENQAYDLKALTDAVKSYPPFHHILHYPTVRRAMETARNQSGTLTIAPAYNYLNDALAKAREKSPPVKVLLYDDSNSTATDIRWTLDGQCPIVDLVFGDFRLAGYHGLEMTFLLGETKLKIEATTAEPGRVFGLSDVSHYDKHGPQDRYGLILPADHFLWKRIYVPGDNNGHTTPQRTDC